MKNFKTVPGLKSLAAPGRRGNRRVRFYPLLKFTGARVKDPAVRDYFMGPPEELRALAGEWFGRMRHCGGDVRELFHDGCANACVDEAPFAHVSVFKSHVNVGFFHGASLPDPAGRLEGSGRFMRHVKLKPGVSHDEGSLEALIVAAYKDIQERLKAEKG